MTTPTPPSRRRGSAATGILLVAIVVALAFGGYIVWQKQEAEKREAEAREAKAAAEAEAKARAEAEAKKKPRTELEEPEYVKEEPKVAREIEVVTPIVADQKDEPPPPPKFDAKVEKETIVPPVRLPESAASPADKRAWAAIKPSSASKTILEAPFHIPVTDLKRRKEIAAIVAEYNQIPVERCIKNPLADQFPGEVKDKVPRLRTLYTCTTGTGGWTSTGFYAPPGEHITVELSEADAKRGFGLRIGSHSDSITGTKREEWHRFPEVCRHFRLDQEKVLIANPFGGLIFLTNARGATPERPLQLRLTGVVRAPVYILGKTTDDEWHKLKAETKGVPWGELVGRKMVLMLPGDQMRDCAKPKEFAEFWDSIVKAQYHLTGADPDDNRHERVNADAEISVGFMHSGYPIGIMLGSAGFLTDKECFKSDNWGINHEVGHNLQGGDWTFKGYGETTNNLIGLYAMETVSKVKMTKVRGGMDWKSLQLQAIAFPKEQDAFALLSYYPPVIEQFGWEPLRKTFLSYRSNPSAMSGDDDKKAEFVYRWSIACGVDLRDYSELFGFPKNHYSKFMFERLKPALKPWMPKGFPPNTSKIKKLQRVKNMNSNEDSHAAAVTGGN